tara:strand:+ start:162 stop:368 length:207 start_codon:yes stop_codon:yes gene_type:complete
MKRNQTYLTTKNERKKQESYNIEKSIQNKLDCVEKQIRDVRELDMGLSIQKNCADRISRTFRISILDV